MSLVNLDTEVIIQVNKRKKVTKEAKVVEAFKERYIKVDLVDEIDAFGSPGASPITKPRNMKNKHVKKCEKKLGKL